MASRTAARDDHVRVDADGRPDQVTPAAGSTVGLELVMSHPAAMDWTHLGVTLRWRLPATLGRACPPGSSTCPGLKLIAEATAPLDDDTARAVEAKILPSEPEDQTTGQLRAALRQAVIAADPEGAEQRRKNAQRHAKVSLYPDPADGTATLAGTRLPAVHAAAAMARLTAIARAMKSAGLAGRPRLPARHCVHRPAAGHLAPDPAARGRPRPRRSHRPRPRPDPDSGPRPSDSDHSERGDDDQDDDQGGDQDRRTRARTAH